MGYEWDFNGELMGFYSDLMGYEWDFNGELMGYEWDFRVI